MAGPFDVKLDQLPVLPAVVTRLMSLSPGSDGYFEEVLSISSEDPALAVRVIHAANSALSAPRQPIETLQGAVARLGAAHIGQLVAALAVKEVFVPRSRGEIDLWIHAVEVATTCRLMVASAPFGVDQHHAYLCGLLHDIGRFVMFDHLPEHLRGLDAPGWEVPNPHIAVESELFGFDHADIGQRLCMKWSIPKRIGGVVHEHHRRQDLHPPISAEARLVALVQMADRLSVLSRTGRLNGLEEDRERLTALIAEACSDPEWPAPPIAPGIVANLVPHVQRAAQAAIEHLDLTCA